MHCNECIIQLAFQDGFVCVDALHPCQQFSVILGCFPKLKQYLAEKRCLDQGHTTVPLVSLKLTTLLSHH